MLNPLHDKNEGTGGEKGRHLWPRLVQNIAEGKNLLRVAPESKSDDKKIRNKE